MPKHTRLMRRGAVYYCRAKVPADLVNIIGKREIQRSLQTSKHNEAVVRVKLVSAEIDAEFAAARRKLNSASKPAVISDTEIRVLAFQWFNDLWQKNRAAHRAPDGMNQQEYIEQLEDELAGLTSSGGDADFEGRIAATARRIFSKADFGLLSPENSAFQEMMELVHRGSIEVTRRVLQRAKGDPSGLGFDPIFAGTGQVTNDPSPKKSITFQELVARFMAVPEKGAWTEKTRSDYEAKFRLLSEVIGKDTLLSSIEREKCRDVQSILTKLPPNAKKRFPNKSVQDVVEYATKHGIAAIAPKTVNQHLHLMSSLFNWARKEGLISRNPAEGLHIKDKGRDIEKRDPFSTEQLHKIFRSGAFASPDRNPKNRGARFWVPLIALFSGCRLGEICQLLTADVVKLDDIWCFRISEEGETEDGGQKTTKTDSAKRIVPVHPTLITLGLIEYREAMIERGDIRLFQEIERASDGYYSGLFSKHFAYFLKSIGAKTPKTSFHSFRHNFADAVKEADMNIHAAHYLAGWRIGTMLGEQYGAQHLKPRMLFEAISKVKYPELKLPFHFSSLQNEG